MSTNHNSFLSTTQNMLTWTTKGKTSSDGETLVKTEGTVNITIPDKPELVDNTRNGSANQSSPMSIAQKTFDATNSLYTIKYKWKHNMGTSGYIDGSLKVEKEDNNDFDVSGGNKKINVSGLNYHSRTDLRTSRLFKVGASVEIPKNTDNNDKGGTAEDNKFYEIPKNNRSMYGPAQRAANPDDIIGILKFTSDVNWISVINNTIRLSSNGWSATPEINVDSNSPLTGKYGSVEGNLIDNVIWRGAPSSASGGIVNLTLKGFTISKNADNSKSITNKRNANIKYTFSVKNFIKNTPDGKILEGIENPITGSLEINQSGGEVTIPNPDIQYYLTYSSADYIVNGDDFDPIKMTTLNSNSRNFTIKFGNISGSKSIVSGGINATFPSTFESFGGTVSNVNVNGISATPPVNYKSREVNFIASAEVKYVDSVNGSTDGIDSEHIFRQSEKITIPQNATENLKGQAKVNFYVDSCSNNEIPYGKESGPSIILGTSAMTFNGDDTNTTSITATSNESRPLSGGVTGQLKTSVDKSFIGINGGNINVTLSPTMEFNDPNIPATNSAFFRICGYLTGVTGVDNINTVTLQDYGKTWNPDTTIPSTGSKLVYCKEIEIKGKPGLISGIASTTATLQVDGGSIFPNYFTFNKNENKTSIWTIPEGGTPTGEFVSAIMDDDITGLRVETTGEDVGQQQFTCNIIDDDVTINSNKLTVIREGISQHFSLNLAVSGDLTYINNFNNDNNGTNPWTELLNANDTYVFTGWSFNTENYLRDTSDLYFTKQGESTECINYAFNLLGGTKKFDIKQFFTEDTTTDRKKVTFNFTGKHEYGDGKWITEISNSWTKTIDRTFSNPSFTLTKAKDELPTKIFNYSLNGNTLTIYFSPSIGVQPSFNVTQQSWNTNGFTNYFNAIFSPGQDGDPARLTSIIIASTDKDINKRKFATLTLTRPQAKIDNTKTFTPTFTTEVSNNVITLSCETVTLSASKTSANIYPTCTYNSTILNSWDISNFVLQSTNNITASFTLPIDTRDSSGNYQLGAFDGGNYKPTLTIQGIPLNNDGNIVGNYPVSGKITYNKTSISPEISSTYTGILTRAFPLSSIIDGGAGTWALDNTYAGFITWDIDNSYLYLNESAFTTNNIPENGVNVTLTYTMKLNEFGTKLNNNKNTVTASTIIHIDGKHSVNIPWTDESN